ADFDIDGRVVMDGSTLSLTLGAAIDYVRSILIDVGRRFGFDSDAPAAGRPGRELSELGSVTPYVFPAFRRGDPPSVARRPGMARSDGRPLPARTGVGSGNQGRRRPVFPARLSECGWTRLARAWLPQRRL